MIACKVCEREHEQGVKGAALGLCSRCYKREKRNLPPLQDAPPKRAKAGEAKIHHTIRMDLAQLKAIRRVAGKVGIGGWIREAVAQRLEREAKR